MDSTFNILLLSIDAAVALYTAFYRSYPKELAALSAWGAAAILLTTYFSQGPFHTFRLYSYIGFLHLPALLLWIAVRRRRYSIRKSIFYGICAVTVALVGIEAFLLEPRQLRVTRYQFASNKIDRPFSIAVVADIQTDHVGKYERKVLLRLKELEPDMILLPGDYIHEPDAAAREQQIDKLRNYFAEVGLNADLGVFATRGNIDDRNWRRLFKGLPVKTFPITESVQAGPFQITGLSLRDSFNPRLQFPQTDRFHIVLGHSPDFALTESGGDLLIAGHTHGGQVRLPMIGPLLTLSMVPRSWAAGMTRLGPHRLLIVSKGIGMERGLAPRLRFNCRPELVVVDVLPQD